MDVVTHMLHSPRGFAPRFAGKHVTPRLASLLASLLVADFATGGTVWLQGAEGISNVPIRSIQERKFDRVVRQQFDFSCGSAALATLLTFHYDEDTDEPALPPGELIDEDAAQLRAAHRRLEVGD